MSKIEAGLNVIKRNVSKWFGFGLSIHVKFRTSAPWFWLFSFNTYSTASKSLFNLTKNCYHSWLLHPQNSPTPVPSPMQNKRYLVYYGWPRLRSVLILKVKSPLMKTQYQVWRKIQIIFHACLSMASGYAPKGSSTLIYRLSKTNGFFKVLKDSDYSNFVMVSPRLSHWWFNSIFTTVKYFWWFPICRS